MLLSILEPCFGLTEKKKKVFRARIEIVNHLENAVKAMQKIDAIDVTDYAKLAHAHGIVTKEFRTVKRLAKKHWKKIVLKVNYQK